MPDDAPVSSTAVSSSSESHQLRTPRRPPRTIRTIPDTRVSWWGAGFSATVESTTIAAINTRAVQAGSHATVLEIVTSQSAGGDQ